jgi:hypothetical protein
MNSSCFFIARVSGPQKLTGESAGKLAYSRIESGIWCHVVFSFQASVMNGKTDLNLVSVRRPLEFAQTSW